MSQTLFQFAGKATHVAIRDKGLEAFTGFAAHVFLDTVQTLDEDLGVIAAVNVLVDILDDLCNGRGLFAGRSDVKGRNVLETFN